MAKMHFPVVETVVGAAVGAADGFVSANDYKNARTKWTDRRAVWLQGGALAAGAIGAMMGMSSEYTDPLILGAAVLGARELAFHMGESSLSSTSTPPAITAWGRPVATRPPRPDMIPASADALMGAAAYGVPANPGGQARQYSQAVSSLG